MFTCTRNSLDFLLKLILVKEIKKIKLTINIEQVTKTDNITFVLSKQTIIQKEFLNSIQLTSIVSSQLMKQLMTLKISCGEK